MAVAVSTGTTKGHAGPNALAARPTTVVRVTFDNSYPTGGEPFDPKQYAGYTPAMVLIQQRAPLTVGYHVTYDFAAKKLLVFWSAGAGAAFSQVTNATDLSALVVDVVLVGD